MSDIVPEGLVRFVGYLALGFTLAVAGGSAFGYHVYQEHRKTGELAERAGEFLEQQSLRNISIEKFRKTDACPKTRPYGATFTATKAMGGFKVEGRICSAPNHESTFTLNP
jgi:hypothetical protein